MHWTEKPDKSPSLLVKTENQRTIWRKSANRTRHQNRKTAAFYVCKQKKTEPKIGRIRKTENSRAGFRILRLPLRRDIRRQFCCVTG